MRVSFPEEVRPQLRAVAAGAVAAAQERYRDHLAAQQEHAHDAPVGTSPDAIRISRDWPAIMRVVDDVVGHDIELRDRLLLRLANADPAEHPDERLENASTT